MIFKSYILEQNIENILSKKILLFYGENEGLKREFKEIIKIKFNDTNILRISTNEVIKDKNILFKEILNKSLFEEKKIIFIDDVNDKLLILIEELINDIEDEKIFLFGNMLDKKSKIRSFFEKNKDVGIAPCYKDNEISIKNIIIKKLGKLKGLNQQIINLISQSTNLDRNKVNNEIEKINCYFSNGKIDLESVEKLLNLRNNDDFNLLSDEALKGNKIKTNTLLGDTNFDAENNFYYLNILNQRMIKLNEIENLKKSGNKIEDLLSIMKPPIFWKDKPILLEQAKRWNKKKINSALDQIYRTELKIKSNSNLRKELLIKNLIIDLCNSANAV